MSALTKILSEAEAETTVIEQATENVEEKVDLLMQAWNAIWPGLLAFGKRLLVAIIIFVVGRIVIKALLKVSKRFFNKVNMETSVSKFLVSVIRILLYVVLIVMVCSQMGIATSSFIAILGSAGLAIGLALQGSLTNFAGGILILLVKPFKVGDYIVYAGGEEGTVSKIDIFYTNISFITYFFYSKFFNYFIFYILKFFSYFFYIFGNFIHIIKISVRPIIINFIIKKR